jgi:Flp pilus assembly protein TadG
MHIPSIAKAASRIWRREDGTATVELAIFMPVFVFFALIAINFARLTYTAVTVAHAARAGAAYGAASPGNAVDAAGIQAAALAEAGDIGTTTISSAPVCMCKDTGVLCTSGSVTCASDVPVYFVEVTASKSLTSLKLPFVTFPATLTRKARLRVQ